MRCDATRAEIKFYEGPERTKSVRLNAETASGKEGEKKIKYGGPERSLFQPITVDCAKLTK